MGTSSHPLTGGRHEWAFPMYEQLTDKMVGYLDGEGFPHPVWWPFVGTDTEADAEAARRLELYHRVNARGVEYRVVPAARCGNLKHRAR